MPLGDEDFKDHNLKPEDLIHWKRHQLKPLSNLTGRDLISGHQRPFKDERLPTLKADSYPKTSTRPICIRIDVELKKNTKKPTNTNNPV